MISLALLVDLIGAPALPAQEKGLPIPTVCAIADFGDPTKPGGPIWPKTNGPLIEGPDGSLYGTTTTGGKHGYGTVYKVTLQGEIITVHDFDGIDGNQPHAGLTKGPDGDFYGTTYVGGEKRVGTIFKISPEGGGVSIIWSFKNGWLPKLPYPQKHPEDEIRRSWPSYPSAAMVLSNGKLRGVTTYTHNQKFGSLYTTGTGMDSFGLNHYFGPEDGEEKPDPGVHPSGLAVCPDGKVYGITATGRSEDTRHGMVFEGNGKAIHKFNFFDGATPNTLTCSKDGNLYGTTSIGGIGSNRRYGVLFKIALPSKQFTVMHKFDMRHGAHPSSHLVEDDKGFLYGAAIGRNRHNEGVNGLLYRIHKDTVWQESGPANEPPAGDLISGIFPLSFFVTDAYADAAVALDPKAYKVIHYFYRSADCAGPGDGLMKHSNNNLFGTCVGGGENNRGTIYRVITNPKENLPQPGRRWCCSLGQKPHSGFYGGALDPTLLAGHEYGITDSTESMYGERDMVGFVYTLAAGLVDIGHVRYTADKTRYIFQMLIEGVEVFVLHEGVVKVTKFPQNQKEALELAASIAYVDAWAHEFATWGVDWKIEWGAERWLHPPQDFSSFSPEDLSSNIVGIEMAKRAIRDNCYMAFNKGMDEQMAKMMRELKAQPKAVTDKVLTMIERTDDEDPIDGKWFEETGAKETLLRRNFTPVPWKVLKDVESVRTPSWLRLDPLALQFSNFEYQMHNEIVGHEGQKIGLKIMPQVSETLKKEWIAKDPKNRSASWP